jgi:hypothetical protein
MSKCQNREISAILRMVCLIQIIGRKGRRKCSYKYNSHTCQCTHLYTCADSHTLSPSSIPNSLPPTPFLPPPSLPLDINDVIRADYDSSCTYDPSTLKALGTTLGSIGTGTNKSMNSTQGAVNLATKSSPNILVGNTGNTGITGTFKLDVTVRFSNTFFSCCYKILVLFFRSLSPAPSLTFSFPSPPAPSLSFSLPSHHLFS